MCVERGGSQEIPRPGLARQQEELVPAEPSSHLLAAQALSGNEPVLGRKPPLSVLSSQQHPNRTKADRVSPCSILPTAPISLKVFSV